MLLLVAVVQAADAPSLADALVRRGVRLTRIGSTGGFLGTGNAVLLIGVDDEDYDDVVATIADNCQTRVEQSVAIMDPHLPFAMPTEAVVGGAVVFGVPVERFTRIPHDPHVPSGVAGSGSESKEEASTMMTPTGNAEMEGSGTEEGMRLVVAVVRSDDADRVIRALVSADVRLTRINTTGGFLRRGNATLLIGVPGSQVDEVLELIESACPGGVDEAPLEKGIPAYSATVFVLDSSHFIRM